MPSLAGTDGRKFSTSASAVSTMRWRTGAALAWHRCALDRYRSSALPQAGPGPRACADLNCFGTIAAEEKAVVAAAAETFGEDLSEKAADEFADLERHGGVAAGSFDPIVLDLECDALLVERDQTTVCDGDTVSVARQIGEHGLGRPATKPPPCALSWGRPLSFRRAPGATFVLVP